MNINENYIGKVSDYTYDGKRVVKAENMPVIFADNGVIGDQVKVRILGKKRGVLQGKVIGTLATSSCRQTVPCPYGHSCGGCDLQEMNYEAQTEWKSSRLERELKKNGVKFPSPCNNLASKNNKGFRNHMQWQVKDGKIGLFAKGTNELVEVQQCMIQTDLGNEILTILSESEAVNNKSLRLIGIRTNTLQEAIVIFVTNENSKINIAAETIVKLSDAGVIGIYQSVESCIQFHYGARVKTLYGEGIFREKIGEETFQYKPTGFFQTNTEITLGAIDIIKQNIIKDLPVIDLYCGVGVLGLSVLPDKLIYGIEYGKEAVEMAKINGLKRESKAVFIYGKAEEKYREIIDKINLHQLILDPPRGGCDRELINEIIRAKPVQIVYLSCNPNTLARDLKKLTDNGYCVKELMNIDMFPWSVHVECIALIQREIS
ncbi:MAG: 23S rRNA (uracil(1939)-C(5))-methyltransferase RlmD [Tissierellia bacterium]|nr:23S rRNA (uracil(1939)-C(5))-methyltransferase RlmD [Tissierellia bacterium]